jgi:formate hydrogenlyase transcriptional activator
LQHVIERAVITAEGSRLAIELPTTAPLAMSPTAPVPAAGRVLTDAEMRRQETDNIREALRQTGGKVSGAGGAAELLEINPSTLASRMKSLGLPEKPPEYA